MNFFTLNSPLEFLEHLVPELSFKHELAELETWWKSDGMFISEATDRAGTPSLRMFDELGNRVDELLFAPEYWRMVQKGYEAGVLWRAFEKQSLIAAYEFLYLTSFYDPGLACPYTVSLATAVSISKYAEEKLKANLLPRLLSKDGNAWQGATWMTEVKGGSDLGAGVETTGRRVPDGWILTGDKYFASNAGAEVAVVAARPEGAPSRLRGLALFAVPKHRRNGELNYFIRRLKDKIATRSVPTGEVELRDSEGYLLGCTEWGLYLILEVLNVSRVANSIGSVGLAHRAIADALKFAQQRVAFGKPIIEHPLLRTQFQERIHGLAGAFALAWESVCLLDDVWQERPPYSERYHLFRLVAHLAKYWTAEFAVQTAKWAMEVHGGNGVLHEYPAERWLREAMILAIWEGTSHRQMLDGLEVMERKHAHHLLFELLAPGCDSGSSDRMKARVERHLALPAEEREAQAEPLFRDLAVFTAQSLGVKREKNQGTR